MALDDFKSGGRTISTLKEGLNRIEEVLDQMKIKDTRRSAIIHISINLIGNNESTAEQIIWKLEGDGIDSFIENHTKITIKAEYAGNITPSRRRHSSDEMASVQPTGFPSRPKTSTSTSSDTPTRSPSASQMMPAITLGMQKTMEASRQAATAVSDAAEEIRKIFQESRGETDNDDQTPK